MAEPTENKSQRSASLYGEAWRKLKKNRQAMVGLFVIVFATLIAILGGNIRPDETENANDQNPIIQKLAPGSKVKHLLVRKNEEIEEVGFFGKLFMGGAPRKHKYYPYLDYYFEGDNITIEVFSSFNEKPNYMPQYKSFSLADVVYPLDVLKDDKVIKNADGSFDIHLYNGEVVHSTVDEMKKEIEANHLTEVKYFLGTDINGRDMLSRVMAGTIISLSVGLMSVIISLFIGLVLGALAGYYRGWIDTVIMWFITVVWSIPALLLIISLKMIMGSGFSTVFIAVGLIMWVDLARLVRGQVLSIREKEYIEAGRALGYSNIRIIGKHVIPNILGPVIVISATNFVSAILLEAGLSFLGIGAKIPMASWGSMIQQHSSYITNADNGYLAIIPGVCIIILVFSFMMVGNGLRDAFDTKSANAHGV
jgi:peptide/nickel transport system permease protein